ncbi:hypothetical protein MKW94_016093, partial [Papaver nudicaule]|nr:hypothetical protein [Papaver nudicaule]
TKCGAAELAQFRAFEGIPPPYDMIKRMVIPNALKVFRLQPGPKYCLLGRLSSEVEWSHTDTIKRIAFVNVGARLNIYIVHKKRLSWISLLTEVAM